MGKIQIVGLFVLLAGISLYFFVEGESNTTIAGLIGGIGFGALLFGPMISKRYKKKNVGS